MLDRDPSVDLSGTTLGRVNGLDNYLVPVPSGGSKMGGSAFASSDLRNAYVPASGLTGAGQSVGVLSYSSFLHTDVQTFESKSGLASDPNQCGQSTPTSPPCLNEITETGFTPGTIVKTPVDYDSEVTSDVELAIGMAPGMANVTVFEEDGSRGLCGGNDLIIADMLSHTGIKVFSTSFGICPDASTSIIAMMAASRQSFVVTSGDGGGGGVPGSPAFSPANQWSDNDVIDVGGTVLSMNGAGASYASEQAWLYSGGGVEDFNTCTPGCTPGTSGCSFTCIPAWQHDIATAQNEASTVYKNEPDVAMPAQSVYVVLGGVDSTFCGTSAAAPLFAGFLALLNQQNAANGLPSAGFATPVIYDVGRDATAYPKSFHDVMGNASTSACTFSGASLPAVPSYDLSTGWGTPKQGLIDQLSCVQCSGSTAKPVAPPSTLCESFQSDANNCGACGNKCNTAAGASCVAGVCQPLFTVMSGVTGGPLALVTDGTSVYVSLSAGSGGAGKIVSAPVLSAANPNASPPVTLATLPAGDFSNNLANDPQGTSGTSGVVFFSEEIQTPTGNADTPGINGVFKSGTGLTGVIPTSGTVGPLAVYGGNLAWLQQPNEPPNDPPSGVFTLVGGNPVTIASTTTSLFAIAADAAHVYWTDATQINNIPVGHVFEAPIGGGTVTTLATVTGFIPVDVSVDANNVYWTNFTITQTQVQSGVMKAPIGGGAVTTLVDGVALANQGLGQYVFSTPVSDGKNVYFGVNNGGLWSVPVNGGNVTVVVSGVSAGPLAIDPTGSNLFWADGPAGTVTQMPLK
jgi:hypothetical protein